jgi:predicted nucleic acid-binding protein
MTMYGRRPECRDAESYLDGVLLPLCEVFPRASLFSQALALHHSAKIAFYDALIVSSALEAGCTVLLTDDLRHEQRIGALQVRNPFL